MDYSGIHVGRVVVLSTTTGELRPMLLVEATPTMFPPIPDVRPSGVLPEFVGVHRLQVGCGQVADVQTHQVGQGVIVVEFARGKSGVRGEEHPRVVLSRSNRDNGVLHPSFRYTQAVSDVRMNNHRAEQRHEQH